ncbi:hypothetical protein ACE1SV_72210 [Streptomyces sp. E-15]
MGRLRGRYGSGRPPGPFYRQCRQPDFPARPGTGALLITAAAGGVGSITAQLVRALTSLTVIDTVSRPETVEFATGMGVQHIVDHRKPLVPSLFQTPDQDRQRHILTQLARLVDAGIINTTATKDLGGINAANLREAHRWCRGPVVPGPVRREPLGIQSHVFCTRVSCQTHGGLRGHPAAPGPSTTHDHL